MFIKALVVSLINNSSLMNFKLDEIQKEKLT